MATREKEYIHNRCAPGNASRTFNKKTLVEEIALLHHKEPQGKDLGNRKMDTANIETGLETPDLAMESVDMESGPQSIEVGETETPTPRHVDTSPVSMSPEFWEQERHLEEETQEYTERQRMAAFDTVEKKREKAERKRRAAAMATKKIIAQQFLARRMDGSERIKMVKTETSTEETQEYTERQRMAAANMDVGQRQETFERWVREMQEKKREEERRWRNEAKEMGRILEQNVKEPNIRKHTYSTEKNADMVELLTHVHNHMSLAYLGVADARLREGPLHVWTPVPTVKDQLAVYRIAERIWRLIKMLIAQDGSLREEHLEIALNTLPRSSTSCFICDSFPNDAGKQRALHSHLTRRVLEEKENHSLLHFVTSIRRWCLDKLEHPLHEDSYKRLLGQLLDRLQLCEHHQGLWRPIKTDQNTVRLTMSVTVPKNIEDLRPLSHQNVVKILEKDDQCTRHKIPSTASLYHAVLTALNLDKGNPVSSKEAVALEALVCKQVLQDKWQGSEGSSNPIIRQALASSLPSESSLDLEMLHLTALKHFRLLVHHPNGTWSKYEPAQLHTLPESLAGLRERLQKPLRPTQTVVLLEFLPHRYDVLLPPDVAEWKTAKGSLQWALKLVEKLAPEDVAFKFGQDIQDLEQNIYAPEETTPSGEQGRGSIVAPPSSVVRQTRPQRIPPPPRSMLPSTTPLPITAPPTATLPRTTTPPPGTTWLPPGTGSLPTTSVAVIPLPSRQHYAPTPSKTAGASPSLPPMQRSSTSLVSKFLVSDDKDTYIGCSEHEFQAFMRARGYRFVQASPIKNRCLFFAVNNALIGLHNPQTHQNPVMNDDIVKENDEDMANKLVKKVIEVQREAERVNNPLYKRHDGAWIFDEKNGFGEDGELLAIAYVLKIRIMVFRHELGRPYDDNPLEYTMLSRDPLNLTPQDIKATIVISCHYPNHYDAYVVSPFPNDWTDNRKVQLGTLERVRTLSPHLYQTLAPESIDKEYYKLQRQTINRLPLKDGLQICRQLLDKDKAAAWVACKTLNQNLYIYVEEFAQLPLDRPCADKVKQIQEHLRAPREFHTDDKQRLWKEYRAMVEEVLELKALCHKNASANAQERDGHIESRLAEIEKQPWGDSFVTALRTARTTQTEICKGFEDVLKDWHKRLAAEDAEGYIIDLQVPWYVTLHEALDALEDYACTLDITRKFGEEREESIKYMMQRAKNTMTLSSDRWGSISKVIGIILKLKMANINTSNSYTMEPMDRLWSEWKQEMQTQQNMSQRLDAWQNIFKANNNENKATLKKVWRDIVTCVKDLVDKESEGILTSGAPSEPRPPSRELSSSTHVVDHSMGMGASSSSASGLHDMFVVPPPVSGAPSKGLIEDMIQDPTDLVSPGPPKRPRLDGEAPVFASLKSGTTNISIDDEPM